MATGNFNLDDPAKQEAIRRGHHEYVPTAGKHGSYVPKQYKHQEYPKMMGKWPRPQLKDFQKTENGVTVSPAMAQESLVAALHEWDRAMETSVVNSKSEELQWLKENG